MEKNGESMEQETKHSSFKTQVWFVPHNVSNTPFYDVHCTLRSVICVSWLFLDFYNISTVVTRPKVLYKEITKVN